MDFEKVLTARKQFGGVDRHQVLVRNLKRSDPSLIDFPRASSGSTSILETL
jgi:hypothetical protein